MSPLSGSVTPQQVPSLETSPVLTPDHQDTTGTAPVLCPAVPGVLNDESPAGLGTRTRGPRDSPRRPVLTPVTPRRALQRPLVRVRGAGERRGRALILVLPVSSRVDRQSSTRCHPPSERETIRELQVSAEELWRSRGLPRRIQDTEDLWIEDNLLKAP